MFIIRHNKIYKPELYATKLPNHPIQCDLKCVKILLPYLASF